MKRVPTIVRDEHPTLETFERVLGKGVMVERGPEDRWRCRWDSTSVAGADLLEYATGDPSHLLFGNEPADPDDFSHSEIAPPPPVPDDYSDD